MTSRGQHSQRSCWPLEDMKFFGCVCAVASSHQGMHGYMPTNICQQNICMTSRGQHSQRSCWPLEDMKFFWCVCAVASSHQGMHGYMPWHLEVTHPPTIDHSSCSRGKTYSSCCYVNVLGPVSVSVVSRLTNG